MLKAMRSRAFWRGVKEGWELAGAYLCLAPLWMRGWEAYKQKRAPWL